MPFRCHNNAPWPNAPAVLSAVQGLQVKANLSQDAVIGITCAILVVLFGVQSWGTQGIGVMFAPIVILWFLGNSMIAIYNIVKFGGGAVFEALSPHWIGASACWGLGR